MDFLADSNGPEEQPNGLVYYLEDQLLSRFKAVCIIKRAISPLRVKDEVEVIGIAAENECDHEMFVTIRWEKDELAVPLSQLNPIKSAAEQTKRAVEDWHYRVGMGYEF